MFSRILVTSLVSKRPYRTDPVPMASRRFCSDSLTDWQVTTPSQPASSTSSSKRSAQDPRLRNL